MKRFFVATAGMLVLIVGTLHVHNASAQGAWTTLFDGKNLEAFTPVGTPNFTIVDGAVQPGMSTGFLVSKQSYGDFEIKAEFWVDTPANSGIFIRCDNPQMPGAETCYEVNIFDTRPDPTYGTGAIVNVSKPSTALKAGGKWNTYEIKAQGRRLIVTLNGVKTVDVEDAKHARGPIALQFGAGVVKFRSVQIRPL
jgi:3-keto-disaccharide hydrolase